ncbi:hypothetical protein EWB00_000798 [Schistosoma japonicum]|uniref:Uncharacterized protein n=1 Tax=Schistosoma japonicum TaxID=6182 RepID=A0A4Z2CKA2_SCHJA|nr:hypothetical protein EWB00_000798 [Schistosoma japonicum]
MRATGLKEGRGYALMDGLLRSHMILMVLFEEKCSVVADSVFFDNCHDLHGAPYAALCPPQQGGPRITIHRGRVDGLTD